MNVGRRFRLVAAAAAALLLLTACEQRIGTPAPVGETRVDCAGVPARTCESSLAEARTTSPVPLVEAPVPKADPVFTACMAMVIAPGRPSASDLPDGMAERLAAGEA